MFNRRVNFSPVFLCSFVWSQLSFRSVYNKDIQMETFVSFSSLPQDRPSSLPSSLLTFSNSLGYSSALATLAARTIILSLFFPLLTCVALSTLCSPHRLYSCALGSSTCFHCSHVTLVVSLSQIHSHAWWPRLSSFLTLPYQSHISAPRNLHTHFWACSAFCFFEVSIHASANAISNSAHNTSSSSRTWFVTFKWNTLLSLSKVAATKMFGALLMQLLLEVLCKSTRTLSIRVIHDGRGRGRYPRHTRWFRGSVGSAQQWLDWHKMLRDQYYLFLFLITGR